MQNMDINEERMEKAVGTLKEWKTDINKELEEALEKAREEAEEIHPEGEKVIEYLKDYTLRGGKRLRPGLIIAGYKAVGKGKYNEIVNASAAIEFLQSYLIIQDDIYDEDDLRRGEPTVHKMYEEYHKEELSEGNSKKFGRDLATIAGDVAASLATTQLLESEFDKETRIKATKKLERINRNTNYGQALDLKTNDKKLENTEEKDVLTVHNTKTANYTVAGPLTIGCILGKGTKKQKEILRNYGMDVGLGFQFYDDILGLYGTKEKLGKPVDSDMKEGKKTLLMIKAYENGNKEQRKKIKETLGNKNITDNDIREIREIVKETGSYEYSRNKCEKLIKRGKKTLEETNQIEKDMKNFLLGIADYIITREV